MDGEQVPAPEAGAPGGGSATPDVPAALAGLARASATLAAAVQGAAWAMTDAESLEALRSVVSSLATGEAAFLGLVRELDRRPDAVPGARKGFVAHTFLTVALHRSREQAGRDVRAARALDPRPAVPEGTEQDLFADGEVHAPALGDVLAAGQTSREHVDLGVRALGLLPKGLLRRVEPDGVRVGAKAEAYLAEQSRVMDTDTFRHVCAQLRAYLDPQREQFDAEAHERRFLHLRMGDDGMMLLRGMIPGADAAVVKAALEAAGAPQPATEVVDEDGRSTLVRDGRTKGQRLADGLVDMSRHVNGCRRDDARGETRVMVVADLDQLAAARTSRAAGAGVGRAHCVQTGPVSALTLQALSCDAVLQAAVLDRSGAVLDLGRSVRTVSAAQRRALIARDRGCVVPGCHAPPGVCHAHHVRWWRHGGPTDLANLALVCGRHHADVHAGIWVLEMVDGVPYGIPPRWAHPGQPRLRNTVHHTDVLARHFTGRLMVDLTDPALYPAPDLTLARSPDTG